MSKKICSTTGRELPENLSGFYRVTSGIIQKGDLITEGLANYHGSTWQFANALIGASAVNWGVYRPLPPPPPQEWVAMSERLPTAADFVPNEWAVECRDSTGFRYCKYDWNAWSRTAYQAPAHWRKVRLAPPPTRIASGHNPDHLTEEQVGVKEGWRLLEQDELRQSRYPDAVIKDVEMFGASHSWERGPWGIDSMIYAYRTKLPCPIPFKRERLRRSQNW